MFKVVSKMHGTFTQRPEMLRWHHCNIKTPGLVSNELHSQCKRAMKMDAFFRDITKTKIKLRPANKTFLIQSRHQSVPAGTHGT